MSCAPSKLPRSISSCTQIDIDEAAKLRNGYEISRWDGCSEGTLQSLTKQAALHFDQNDQVGAHSLRFRGASALWSAYHNADQLKRHGRWTSDVFHEYIWDARSTAKGVADVEDRFGPGGMWGG